MWGFILFEIGSIFYIGFCIINLLGWFILTQSIFMILDCRGIINCLKEIKGEKK